MNNNEAAEAYAKIAGRNSAGWRPIKEPVPGVWYDFYDLATGKFGQCLKNEDGTWHQAPRGNDPTMLEFNRHGWQPR